MKTRGVLTFATACLAAATPNHDYSEYILAPATRALIPSSVHQIQGNVLNAASLLRANNTAPATINGIASITVDFHKNVAGIVSVRVGNASSRNASLSVTFSESSEYVSSEVSDATQDAGRDMPLSFHVGAGRGTYTAAGRHNRGAFRYLTIAGRTPSSSIDVEQVTVNFTAAPSQDLTAYTGHFHCDDELLNRIWYAGAYTNQLCTIDPSMGSALNVASGNQGSGGETNPVPWWSNTTIANGSTVLTDGAKRDRLVWPGDMAISLDAVAVSTYNLDSVKNAIEALLARQTPDGRLPFATPPLPDPVSFTYHCHGLLSMIRYYLYSGDQQWLSSHWSQFANGIRWALSSIDHTDMANITDGLDWRFGVTGHNIEANAILYYTLNQAVDIAVRANQSTNNDSNNNQTWIDAAQRIKSAANRLLWDAEKGLYRDNETSTLHPQDGNAWSIKANLTESRSQASQIASSLHARWGKYGAPAPEVGVATVSPFIGGVELQAHYEAGHAQFALDLMRLEWGFMLNDPRMTHSTFIEGYSANGSLHYEPYANDARVSHAHAWSTGPTFALMQYAAGLRLHDAAGAEWLVAPQPGDLQSVDAGFTTNRGRFAIVWDKERNRAQYCRLSFSAPGGTRGSVRLPGVEGKLVAQDGAQRLLRNGEATGLSGGVWELVL